MKAAVELSHIKEKDDISVSTDAPDKFWAGVMTQVRKNEIEKEVQYQYQKPLAFLSGHVNKAQENWTTYKKEALAIVKVFEKLDYVLWGPNTVKIYTDHKTLLYVFDPLALQPN